MPEAMRGAVVGAEVQYRKASASDARAVAALHADSWRRHYRGAYSDAFLDYEALELLGRTWSERLTAPTEIWLSGMNEKICPTPRSSCEATKSLPLDCAVR